MALAMASAVDDEYRLIIETARAACREEPASRLRILKRLRKELARVRARDYFPTRLRQEARAAVDELVTLAEVSG